MSDDPIAGLEPERLWTQFARISAIPRCSTHEERIREYVVGFAHEHRLVHRIDGAGNVAIRKPAHPSKVGRPSVVLQGHLDMVCEKNQGTEHDFSKDPIRLVHDGEWLRAAGTTLGADNGIALAAALAVLDDPNAVHGPLQALFTVDEESGLVGATNMDPSLVDGQYLINIDSEEEGVFYIGCAGGQNTEGWIPVTRREPPPGVAATIAVRGLRGGHSGAEIHEGRGNAVVLGNRFLWHAAEKLALWIYDITAGGLHNAIPREFFAKVVVDQGQLDALMRMARDTEATYRTELGDIEPALSVSVTSNGDRPESVLDERSSRRLLDTIYALPHGVTAMSRKIKELVETSTNLAAVHLLSDELHVLTSQRSSYASARDDLADKVSAVIRNAGGHSKYLGVYPSWPPDPDSDLVALCREVYRKQSGRDPEIKAIHAGLECGVIGEKAPGIRMISFGPNIRGAHTPDERVHIESTARVWRFLLEVLRNL